MARKTQPPKATLNPFEGIEVASAGIKLAGAATGLSDAMRVEAAEYHQGDELNLTLRVIVDKVVHEPHDRKDVDDHRLRRVHVLNPLTAFFQDDSAVANDLQQHRDALAQLPGQLKGELGDGEGAPPEPEWGE